MMSRACVNRGSEKLGSKACPASISPAATSPAALSGRPPDCQLLTNERGLRGVAPRATRSCMLSQLAIAEARCAPARQERLEVRFREPRRKRRGAPRVSLGVGRDRSGSGWRKHGVVGWLSDCSTRWRVRSTAGWAIASRPKSATEAACRALSRAIRRTRGGSRSIAAARSPTRPGRGDPASPNRIFAPATPVARAPRSPRRRRARRRSCRRRGRASRPALRGEEELLVADCPGVFHKPRISGHVNRAPEDSRATHSGLRGVPWVRKTGPSGPTFRLIGVRYAESVSAAGQAAKLPLAGLAVVPLRKHSRSQTSPL